MIRESIAALYLFFSFASAFIPVFSENLPFAEATASISSDGTTSSLLIRTAFHIPEGYYQSNQSEYFYLDTEVPSGSVGSTDYPVAEKFRGTTILESSFLLPGKVIFPFEAVVTVHYQLCEESGTCYFPKSHRFTLLFPDKESAETGLAFSIEKPDYPAFGGEEKTFPGFSASEKPSNLSPPAAVNPSGSIANVFFVLFFAFVGGLLLNVMPCVLPVLSIKAMHLIQLQGESRASAVRAGALYSLGIISSLLALGVTAAALKALGEISGWGFQFQNPFFTITLSLLIFAFALSMFDVFIFNLPGLTFAERNSHRSGAAGTFLSGIFAVLLATPCTAPFMGSALGLAFSLGPGVIIASFAAVGLGLALPFFLLSVFPSLLSWMPKPGKWMAAFKQFLGFLLFATLLWLLNTAYYQLGWNGVRLLTGIFLILGVLFWYFGYLQKTAKKPLLRKILLLVIAGVFVSGIFIAAASNGRDDAAVPDNWRAFSSSELETERSRGNPVFVAFSAQWCLTCKTNEVTVLNTRDMQRFFKERNTRLLYGDYTNGDPEIAEWIRFFGKSGVPVYALFLPDRGEPIVLPEVLTKKAVISSFSQ